MKKTYLTPQTDIMQIDGTDQLLTASNPATEMAIPFTGIDKGTDGGGQGDSYGDWGC